MKAYYQSPVGILEIVEDCNFITSLCIIEEMPSEINEPKSPILKETIKQLSEYFGGKRKDFTIPLKQEGSIFQQKAWKYLSTIPYGRTVSYKEEAIAIGSPKGSRAAGSANGKNNIAIIVPCHRVINGNGKLGGYAYGLNVKEYLLKLEQVDNNLLFDK